MMAHAVRLLNYEPQRFSSHEYTSAGARREEPLPQVEHGTRLMMIPYRTLHFTFFETLTLALGG